TRLSREELGSTFDQIQIRPQHGVEQEGNLINAPALVEGNQIESRHAPHVVTEQVAQEIGILVHRQTSTAHLPLHENKRFCDQLGIGRQRDLVEERLEQGDQFATVLSQLTPACVEKLCCFINFRRGRTPQHDLQELCLLQPGQVLLQALRDHIAAG